MKKIILYGHGGSSNHGCEALVRSTIGILQSKLNLDHFILATNAKAQDEIYLPSHIATLFSVALGAKNYDFFKSWLSMKMSGNYAVLDAYPYHSLLRHYNDQELAISIGGDNYCYGDISLYAYLNKLFNKNNHKTILWGCSLEPDSFSKQMIDDMNTYKHIFARESISYEALKKNGILHISLCPDPAFTLKADTSSKDIISNNTVGINVSPMIISCESTNGVTLNNYISLIEYIIKETDMKVALIPHVVWSNNDDRKPLQILFDHFKETGRVFLIRDANAEILKGQISKCRFMIAARTHASIAAYSTCVPTLVVGYSVKAKGIAKDIFGTYDNYVLSVQQLQSPDDLTKNFQWLMANESSIRLHLQDFMPGYIQKAWEAGQILQEI